MYHPEEWTKLLEMQHKKFKYFSNDTYRLVPFCTEHAFHKKYKPMSEQKRRIPA